MKYGRLTLVASLMWGLAGCGDSAPEAASVQQRFPAISSTGSSCAETSSYLSAMETGRYGLVVGNVRNIAPRLHALTLDGGTLMTGASCSAAIYPSLDLTLSDVRTSFAHAETSGLTVSFNSEFVERWSPQPVVPSNTGLRWLNAQGELFASSLDSSVRIALLVSQDSEGQLVAYEGWLAEVLADGKLQMISADACEIVGAERTEAALLAAVEPLSNDGAALTASDVPTSYLWSLCGQD